jgi:hypothetical protein
VANCLASLAKLGPPGPVERGQHLQAARQVWEAAGLVGCDSSRMAGCATS